MKPFDLQIFLIVVLSLLMSSCYGDLCELDCHRELDNCISCCKQTYLENSPECVTECYDYNMLCDYKCK
jgi:hypothetical protein